MSKKILTERQLEAQRRYNREWRKAHADRVREYRSRWLDKLADQMEAEDAQDEQNEAEDGKDGADAD